LVLVVGGAGVLYLGMLAGLGIRLSAFRRSG
jgi:hypothetical protein